jgi:hypothetical protein
MEARRSAPFTPAEVESFNDCRQFGSWQPLICAREGCRREMVATESGLNCPGCSYTQDWAPTWMMDGTWRKTQEILKREG